jgi:hypothetical protein
MAHQPNHATAHPIHTPHLFVHHPLDPHPIMLLVTSDT